MMALIAEIVDISVISGVMALHTEELGSGIRRRRTENTSVAVVTSSWSFQKFCKCVTYPL